MLMAYEMLSTNSSNHVRSHVPTPERSPRECCGKHAIGTELEHIVTTAGDNVTVAYRDLLR